MLYTLELRAELNDGLDVSVPQQSDADTSSKLDTTTSDNLDGTTKALATSCALCNLDFSTVLEQRSHVRSDLHGYNLKQKMRGQTSVNENEFDKLVGDLNESLSGSDDSADTSSSDEDEDGGGSKKKTDTTLSALLRKQANIADPNFEDEDMGKRRKTGSGKAPLLWFTSEKLPQDTSLGIYRAIFTPAEQLLDSKGLVEVLQRKQLASASSTSSKPHKTVAATSQPFSEEDGGVALPPQQPTPSTPTSPHYFLCMIGGGHFAAMLVSLTPKTIRRNGIESRDVTVIAHKGFHRYTTRRKQGGSQSANDNSKGNAHSAGAGIRRYNEAALVTDVRSLLSEWKDMIDSAELLFLRATGSTNRKTLFENYEGRVLDAKDERIRGFPFSTRRATQKELMRSFVELTRVKTSVIDYDAIRRKAAEEQAARDKATAEANRRTEEEKQRKAQDSVSKREMVEQLNTQQIQNLIRRSKAPALLTFISENGVSPDLEFYPANDPKNHHAPRPLHWAASLNSPACVTALLTKAGSNPTLRTLEGQSAFALAGDRPTRDAFRLARHQLGETKWDWDSAGVPPALTKEEADARAAREKDEAAALNAAESERRKAETERLREEDRKKEEEGKTRQFGKGRSLGILAEVEKQKSAQEKREDEARGMTPEMRMKLERERRARAAEARFAKK